MIVQITGTVKCGVLCLYIAMIVIYNPPGSVHAPPTRVARAAVTRSGADCFDPPLKRYYPICSEKFSKPPA
jgi:hypothetical protein